MLARRTGFRVGTPRRAHFRLSVGYRRAATGTLDDKQYPAPGHGDRPRAARTWLLRCNPLPQLVPIPNLANGPDLNGGVPLMDTSLPEPSPPPTLNWTGGAFPHRLRRRTASNRFRPEFDGACSPNLPIFRDPHPRNPGAEGRVVSWRATGFSAAKTKSGPFRHLQTTAATHLWITISVGLTTNGQQIDGAYGFSHD